jgi:uncharacterized protein YndB with AHSA1/START domain
MREKIAIEVIVKRERGDVWARWNEPEHIVNWNFASADWCCPRAENDLKVGGRLLARMEAKDGSFGFDFEAVYDEVAHEAKLAYTLTDGRRVETRFEESDGGTLVSTVFEAEEENSVELQKMGWQAILDNFKQYAESSQI